MKKISTTNTVILILFCCLLFSSKLINAQCHIDDWTALKALYEATDGDNWTNNDGWEVVKNVELIADCNLENLYGIRTDAIGRVSSITVNNNKLEGSLPFELGLLSNLKYLSIAKNGKVIGGIPPELGNLTHLINLNLFRNKLSGDIPSELGNLSKLKELILSANGLKGNIPSELGKLKNLEILHLYSNKLDGSIPPELGDLINLNDLKLYSNQLNGNIPRELSRLSLLSIFELNSNKLNGNIPAELSNLNNLKRLDFSNNILNGNIPPELGNLSNLKNLNISANNLNGSIPPEFSNLSNLTNLNISVNNLNGNIPPELGNLNSLTKLELSYNQLNGHIPVELSNLTNLESLVLDQNNLNGSIPPELGDLINLRYLVLAYNQLSGNIPPELGNLELGDLDLSRNQLTGSIPKEISKINGLALLNLRSNQLSGSIPSQFNDLKYLHIVDLSDNQLSGTIPNLSSYSDDYISLEFDISFNNFTCNEIEIFNHRDFSHMNYGISNPIFYYSPQNYYVENKQSFNINNPLESISLAAPFSKVGNFAYQWYNNNRSVRGATDSILILNSVQFEDVGNYTLHIYDQDCILESSDEFYENLEYISDPISVRRTDLEGCTDQNSCNYNQFVFIDDGSCEYLWCDTMTNPIKIRTTNEVILSDTQIKFDLVIDSLGLDYSADNLTFTLDTRGNYRIDSIQVINPILSPAEVDISKLYKSTFSINRINNQRLASGEPILSAIACIPVDDVPTDEMTCSHFVISGGTQITSGHFIDFDNVYIDIPFSDCSPYGDYGAEGKNWLPLVLTLSPQNCDKDALGFAEIKILEEGQSPFSYTLKNEQGAIILEATNTNKLIEVPALNAGNYELTVFDMDGKKTTMHTCIPLVNSLDGNETCQTNCVDYVIVPDGEISGLHQAKKEIEIKGFVGKDKTVEFGICD